MVLGYLISPVVQIVDSHGKPIVGAKIYVYKAGTTNTVNTYCDFSNHYNPTPVLTDTLGNCTIIASDDMIYDIVVKDNRNNLLMSKDNLTVSSGINPDINLRFNEGYGIIIRKNGNTVTIAVDTDVIATKDDLATKQDKMYAGDNIEITPQNQINVVNRRELLAEYPIKMDRSNNRLTLYIDEEYLDNIGINSLVAGPDIAIGNLGNSKIIGVDTNSTADGDYNFYAGNGNTLSGNNNAAFGYCNEIDGSYNAIFGASNGIEGDKNLVFGQRNIADSHSQANLIGGIDITANQCSYNLFGGSQNSAYLCAGSNLIGYNNILQRNNYTYVGGNSNNLTFFDNSICVGNNNLFNAAQGASHAAIIGRYNTISGTGYGNDMIIGSQNTIDGSNDFVVGNNNTVDGDNKYIVGNNNNASGTDNMYVFGHAASGIAGGIVLGVEGHNNFEIRKNDDIYYKYNNQMLQLAPYTGGTGITVNNHTISCNGDITPYTAGDGITINNHIISQIPWSPKKHEGRITSTSQKTITYAYQSDIFSIAFDYDKTQGKTAIKVYNNNPSGTRYIWAKVNHSGSNTKIQPQQSYTINTVTLAEDFFDLDLMFMGSGDELPVCSFTISIDTNALYCQYTIYDKMITLSTT